MSASKKKKNGEKNPPLALDQLELCLVGLKVPAAVREVNSKR